MTATTIHSTRVSASSRLTAPSAGSRLIMVFLGWGMSPEPFLTLAKPGYDVMLLWEYRLGRDGIDDEILDRLSAYREIVVVAWSFGVVAASYMLDSYPGLPVTRKVAVNGTPRHIDRRFGIPPAVFSVTLRGLSPAAVVKFTDRMFADVADRGAFAAAGNSRSFDSVLEELRLFGGLPVYSGGLRWDFAVVGGRDAIFPPANQSAFWAAAGCRAIERTEAGHYVGLQSVIDDFVVDKELVASRFGGVRDTYRDSAGVQRGVAEKLWRLTKGSLSGPVASVLEVGAGEGLLTELYAPSLSPETLVLWDIADIGSGRFPPGALFERCDAEEAVRRCPLSFDLVISASTLQWFHSPETFVANAMRLLRPGGLLALSFFGDGTYREVSDITGVSLKYPDPSVWDIDGEVVLLEKDSVAESFADAAAAVRHIGRTGVNALRRDRGASVSAGRRLMRELPENPGGGVSLTYVPYYMIIRKPTT